MRQIYLDHASTTPVRPEVVEAMTPYFTEHFGNPSSIYPLGQEASDAVAAARESLAGLIGAAPREIFFTSGGTESDNWAIKGFARANAAKGRHIITSAIEHHAVLHTCQALEREGFEVTYLPVDEHGLVSVEDFKAAMRPDTILASIMFANNEIGTIEPVRQLAAAAHEANVVFHTDAVQAFGHEPIDVNELGILPQDLRAQGRRAFVRAPWREASEPSRWRPAGARAPRFNGERARHRRLRARRRIGGRRACPRA